MTDWDPEQYARFAEQRRAPFFDLAAMVEPRSGMRTIDLGCGGGELTEVLHRRLACTETVGLDSSEAMLAKAAAHAGEGLSFRSGDIGALEPDGSWDLVFSNAALHWVDDHEALVERLAGALAPLGQLAFQVPANHDHIAHVTADEVAREEPFATALGGYVRGVPVLDPRGYAELLWRLGFRRQLVELRIYCHELPSVDGAVEWVKGSLLNAFKQRMSADLFEQMLQRYRARMRDQLGDQVPYLLTYKRIFVWATDRV